jgi:hypothetical protein
MSDHPNPGNRVEYITAEVMDAAEIKAVPLVPAKVQDGHIDGAVAQEHAIGFALPSRLRAMNFDEVEGRLEKFRGCIGVLGRDRDVSKLCH